MYVVPPMFLFSALIRSYVAMNLRRNEEALRRHTRAFFFEPNGIRYYMHK